jgi:hemolysin-activating ACP:hemolysin acyltransferase
VALGLAVTHLMVQPAFANLRFGDWSRVLVGQINRRHYYFAIDEKKQTQGFLGWALTTKDTAEAWLAGRAALSYEDSRDGDCVIINAWSANSPEAGRLLRDAARRIGLGKQAVYFKRHYKDGTTRPMRLSANAFVEKHLERNAENAG